MGQILAIQDFINTLDQDLMGVFLFGSRAKGTHHDQSDVDLYVVHKGQAGQAFYTYEGMTYQIQWRSEEAFKSKILKQGRGEPLGLYGKIVYDPTGLMAKYLTASAAMVTLGPKALTSQERKSIEAALNADLKSISTMPHGVGMLLELHEILLTLLDLYYDTRGWWQVTRKHVVDDLIKRDPKLGQRVARCMLTSDLSKKLMETMALKDILI